MLKSRVLLLQLMQNCFPMLPNPLESQGPVESKGSDQGATAAACPSTSSSVEPLNDTVRAVREVYTHLCHSKNLSAIQRTEAALMTDFSDITFLMFVF